MRVGDNLPGKAKREGDPQGAGDGLSWRSRKGWGIRKHSSGSTLGEFQEKQLHSEFHLQRNYILDKADRFCTHTSCLGVPLKPQIQNHAPLWFLVEKVLEKVK